MGRSRSRSRLDRLYNPADDKKAYRYIISGILLFFVLSLQCVIWGCKKSKFENSSRTSQTQQETSTTVVKCIRRMPYFTKNLPVFSINYQRYIFYNLKLCECCVSETINGKEGTSSHLVTIPPGPHLTDALVSSPVLQVGNRTRRKLTTNIIGLKKNSNICDKFFCWNIFNPF